MKKYAQGLISNNRFIYLPVFLLVIGIFLFASPSKAFAAACISTGSGGNWNVNGTWTSCGGTTPGSGDSVEIANSTTVTVNTSPTVLSVKIDATGTLNYSGTRTLTITPPNSSSFTAFDNSAGGTYTSNGSETIDFNIGQNQTYTITGSTTINNLTFDGCPNPGGWTISSGTTLTVNGTLNLSNRCTTYEFLNGSGGINALGNISVSSEGIVGDAVITINGTGSQTLSGDGVGGNKNYVPAININKSSGTLTISNTLSPCQRNNSNTSYNCWTYTVGNLVTTGSTINFELSMDNTSTVQGSANYNNVTFTGCSNSATVNLPSGTALTVSGTLTFSPACSGRDTTSGGGTITAQGDITTSGNGNDGSVAITLSGSGNQTITASGTNFPTGTVTLNKSGGTITLAAAWALTSSGQDLLVQAGSNQTITGAFNLTVDDQFQISGTLTQGTTTFVNGASGAFNLSKSGIWNNTSTGDMTVGSGGVINNGTMNFNLPNTCGAADTNISITSTSGGVARNWSGNGYYNLYDITVQDQNESPQKLKITAWSSTATSNTNWQFRTDCPKPPTAYWKFDEGYGTTTQNSISTSATPAYVQGNTLDTSGTSVTVAYTTQNIRSGNLLIAAIRVGLPGVTISVTDNNSNTWTRIDTGTDPGSDSTYELWYAPNAIATPNAKPTLTITSSLSTTMRAIIEEYSGIATSSPLDQHAITNGTNSPTIVTSGKTTQANELAVNYVGNSTTTTATNDPNYTLNSVIPASPNTKLLTQFRTINTIGTQTANSSFTGGLYWASLIATFKTDQTAQALLAGTTFPTWQTEDQCISGKCLFFDGSTSKVTVNQVVKSVQSVGMWVRPTVLNSTNALIDLDGGTHKITSNSSGTLTATGFSSPTIYVNGISGGTITLNRWNYVEVTTGTAFDTTSSLTIGTDGTNYTKGFIDEVKIYSYVRTASQVGSDYNSRGGFTGSSEQVSNAINNNPKALSDGLVGYWKTDEDPQAHSGVGYNGTSGEVVDSSGNGNNGTYTGTKGVASTAAASCGCSSTTLTVSGTPWTASGLINFKLKMTSGSRNGETSTITANTSSTLTFSPALTGTVANGDTFTISDMDTGKFGNGGVFNGLNNYVDIPNNTNLHSDDGTFSAWIKTSSDTDQVIYSVSQAATSSLISVEIGPSTNYCTNELISVQIDATGLRVCYNTANRNELFDGKWHHIVVTADTSTKIYLDGVQKTVTIANGPDTGNFTQSGSYDTIRIGNTKTSGTDVNSVNGTIDDVRVYNRALSPADVTNLYNFAPGPVGKWDFEEGSGSTVNDTSGNAYTGTWQGTLGSQWKPGKYGGAGNFNNTDNYVDLGTPSALSMKGDISISAWVKPTSTTFSNQGAIMANVVVAGTSGIEFYFQDANTLHFDWDDCFCGNADNFNVTYSFVANNWYHVAVTKTGQTVIMYINGVAYIATHSGSTKSDSVTVSNTTIGRDGMLNTQYFAGLIDQVRYYNYIRTQKQIVEDMNAGHPAPGSPVGTPIGYWRFDEGYGTTYHNSGSCGSTCDSGVFNSVSWTNDGKFGKAITTNATGFLLMPSDLSQFKITGAITLSAWIKGIAAGGGNRPIIAKSALSGGFGNRAYELYLDNNSKLNMHISSDGTALTTATGATALTSTTTWYHVVGVYNPGNSITVYVNAIQDGQNTTSIPASINNGVDTFRIGADDNSTTFNGTIDEPKVYSGALTADQVKVDMNGGQVQQLGAAGNNSTYQAGSANQEYCVPGDATSCAAPVGRWDFEEGSYNGTSSEVKDTSGNGNNGNFTASPSNTSKPGKFGKAANFDGSDYIQIPYINLGTSALTYTMWFKPTTATDQQSLISLMKTLLRIDSSGGHIYWYSDSGVSSITISTTINPNTWYFIAVTQSGTTYTVYLNGQQVGTGTTNAINNTNDWNSLSSWSNGNNKFTGLEDNVRIYNYARTPAQVAWDYNRGAPDAWYRMDECQGTTINDQSGNGNTGTLTVGAGGTQTAAGTCTTASTAWGNGATGKINSSLNFDGTDDYVSTTDSNSLMKSLTSNFTVSAWIKAADTAATERIVGNINDTTGNLGWGFGQSNGGKIRFSTFGTQDYVTTNTYITPGTWQHLVVVFTSTFSAQFYVNGVLVQTITGAQAPNNSGTPGFFIGFSPQHNEYWKGQIDDVRVYNYALTSTQIQQIYNNGAVNFAPSTGTP